MRRVSRQLMNEGHAIWLVATALCACVAPSAALGQESPLPLLRELGLRSTSTGPATLYSTPGYEEWAGEIVDQSIAAVRLFADSLDLSFDFNVAVLMPPQWVTWFVNGDDVSWENEQYGMPWAWPPDRLIAVPATFDEGLVIRDPSDVDGNKRLLRFIALHELGHVSTREFFYPTSEHRWSPVGWFEELLASYFAVAFVSLDDEGAEFVVTFSTEIIATTSPPFTNLDVMHQVFGRLPPSQAAANYGWYQAVLNLKAIELHERHGFGFLVALRDALAWDSFEEWSTDYLLDRVDTLDPGFRAWAHGIQGADRRP